VVDGDGRVRIWDGRAVEELEGRQRGVLTAGFADDSRVAFTVGTDGTVRFWDLSRRTELETLRRPGVAAAVSPEANVIAVRQPSGAVQIYPCRFCGAVSVIRRTARDELRTPSARAEIDRKSGAS